MCSARRTVDTLTMNEGRVIEQIADRYAALGTTIAWLTDETQSDVR